MRCILYRHFATLFFIFVTDHLESELGILDLIQVSTSQGLGFRVYLVVVEDKVKLAYILKAGVQHLYKHLNK